MKTGIVTFYNALSYGATLQAYALQEVVKSMGHEAFIVNYIPSGIKWPSLWKCLLSRNISGFVAKLNNYRFSRRFDSFIKGHLNLSSKVTLDSDFNEINGQADAFICGSDQIWAERGFSETNKYDQIFFLNFVDEDKLRIAYGPSFGSGISMDFYSAISTAIAKIKFLSIRESSIAEMLSKLAGRKVACVCDPTILLGKNGFDRIIEPSADNQKDDYVFNYLLSRYEPRDRNVTKYVCRLMGAIEAKIALRPFSYRQLGVNVIPSPCEWIGLVRDARFVVTNSFHGTVFSILYHRPFISLGWQRREKNTRMRELLAHIGLSDRLIETEDDISRIESLCVKTPDWDAIDDRLSKWRNESIRYLADSLAHINE